MRGVSRWASRVAPLVAAFVVFGAARAWAEEPPAPPTEPPGARMNPPVGVSTQAPMQPPVGVSTQARLNPPVGVITYARASPPVGAPTAGQVSLLDLLLTWLRSRISIPHG